ncbi:MAG: SH3 domain-containing protein [Brevinema sp.]
MKISMLVISFTILTGVPSFTKNYEHPQNLYNSSLESYEKHDLGHAMFYAKKAIKLAPGDNNIRSLFFKIRQDLGLPSIFSEDQFSHRLTTFLFQSFPPHLNAFAGGILFILASGIISLLMFNQIRIPKFVPIILFTLSFFMMIQAVAQYYFFNKDERVVLATSTLYEEPSINSTKLQDIPAGTEVSVIDQTEEFLLIKLLNSTEAWILSNHAPILLEPISQ